MTGAMAFVMLLLAAPTAPAHYGLRAISWPPEFEASRAMHTVDDFEVL